MAAAAAAIADEALAAACARSWPACTERAEFGRALDFEIAAAGRQRPVVRDHRGRRARTRPSPTTGRRARASGRASLVVLDFGATRRRLPLGHDPDRLGRRAGRRRAAPSRTTWCGQPGRRAWPRWRPGVARRRRPGLPPGDRRRRLGRAVRARHRPRRRPRHPRGPLGGRHARPIHCRSATWSPSSRACTCPASAACASRTPSW